MSLTHDIIKIKYTRLGYLPNYPYHLISDEEMFNAFINLSGDDSTSGSGDSSEEERFFNDNYPNPFADSDIEFIGAGGEKISLRSEYFRLKKYIIDTINQYLANQGTTNAENYTIPDWIYTYMLGEVIYNNSEYLDIHDALMLLDNVYVDSNKIIDEAGEEDWEQLLKDNHVNNEFTRLSCVRCYIESTKYISTLTTGIRPPTVFGEPHVIKQLRLEA